MQSDINEIKQLYVKLKSKATTAINLKRYNSCIAYLKGAAYLAYGYNFIYQDKDIEEMLSRLAKRIIKNNICPSNKDESYSVFYDAFTMDNRGLSQQYLRAMMDNNLKFVYITERGNITGTNIYKELISYPNVKIICIPNLRSSHLRTKFIHKTIIEYSPCKIIMHLKPWSVEALIAVSALPRFIRRYNINLTDHAFWLGNSLLDYNIEFRNLGASLSINKRDLRAEQLLLLPYYPIQDYIEFKGFPVKKENDSDVLLFSGSSLYKIYGNNNEFLFTIKAILDTNPNAYFLFAGGGNPEPFISFVKENRLEKKMFYLGFRKDINEIIKHIDIYIDTFPVSGGLMGEYAIVNKKPILVLKQKDCDGNKLLGGLHSLFPPKSLKVSENKKDLISRATLLIKNKDLRVIEGEDNCKLVPSRQSFGEMFIKLINTDKSPCTIDFIPNNKLITNKGMCPNFEYKSFLKILGLNSILLSPKVFIRLISSLFTKKEITSIIKHIISY